MSEVSLDEVTAQIKAEVTKRLGMLNDTDDDTVSQVIDRCIFESPHRARMNIETRQRLKRRLFDSLRRLDVLSPYLDDAEVTEIMVNGPSDIFTERRGRIQRETQTFSSVEELENLIQQIVAGVNRRVNEASPIVDARLADGSRVNIVLRPIALDGPVMTIRKFSKNRLSMESLIANGSLDAGAAEFLKKLVRARYNIFVSGGTGSGKTTLLNCLSEYIDSGERVVTIEDSAELMLQGLPNLVRLETRAADTEGVNSITIRDLIRSALRMRPDRIIVGEVRGGESIDLLQAMNTGHDGSLSTGHANSPRDMLRRLETMCLMSEVELPLMAVRGQIASAIDIIVQVGRLRDGSRRVLAITEVGELKDGDIEIFPLYEFIQEGEEDGRIRGRLTPTGQELKNREKLEREGIT